MHFENKIAITWSHVGTLYIVKPSAVDPPSQPIINHSQYLVKH